MSVRDSKTNFSAGAFSIALFAVGLFLWGCGGSGCGGGSCSPIGCPTPKEGLSDNILGHVAYGDTPTSDTIVASVGSDGDIYFQLTGSDPSQGPNWISWAHYFKLHPFGLHDWDQAVITFYPDASQSCDTSTTNYYLQDNKLSLQVTWDESDVIWEAGEHDMIMTITDPGTQPLVGLPNCLSADDPDKTITVKVHLWDAHLLGPDTVERGENAEYEMKHDDLPTTYVVGYLWNSDWGTGEINFPSNGTLTPNKTWEGTLVTTNTQVTCGMRVRPPFMADSTIYRSTETLITARNWHLDPPAAPGAIDTRTDWIAPDDDLMDGIMCVEAGLSRLIDRGSSGNNRFHPNEADPANPTHDIDSGLWSGVSYSQITSGPNSGVWFIGSANYQIDQEIVLNKWIRETGPSPHGSSTNWFDENTSATCFSNPYTSATLTQFYTALKDHEGFGNIDTNNDNIADNGHYHRVLLAETANPDMNRAMEALVESSKVLLAVKVLDVWVNLDQKVGLFSSDHGFVKDNWFHYNGASNYQSREWHTSGPQVDGNGSWAPQNGPCDCYTEAPW